jgi:hypothetical protein
MYLWQPVGSAFYPPCVDGDFDMSVIGHEYTHAISNRMVAGPDDGLTSDADGQARAMGESFSDLTAVEYLMEHGYAPEDDENPFAVGAYVTGSKQKGIRNYGMNASPLNYSDVQGYDGSGTGSPHDDGEIWSAANFDIRQALVAKYGSGTAADQLACARGQRPADQCPGNRRWMQIVFDAYLLMAPEVSMLDSRDAYLAADRLRFGGANQDELWNAFARRGFGQGASSPDPTPEDDSVDFGGTDNPDPVASFASPRSADESALTFKPVDESGNPLQGELFVGEYEANVTPVADTDGGTPRGATVEMLPGEYSFVARADGRGAVKFTRTIPAAKQLDLTVTMPANRASADGGATISGEGVNQGALIDDTEETNWAVVAREPDVAGAEVTVDLAGGEQVVDRVQASALLRAADDTAEQEDPGAQNRFTALRQFEILTCSGTCEDDADFDSIYTSPEDAFPGGRPAWERAGAVLTDDAGPWERLKLRALNGVHSTAAYLGALAGRETIADALQLPHLTTVLRRLVAEDVAASFDPPDGVSVVDYGEEVLARFANPAIHHRTLQVAMDGSQKLPQRVLHTIADLRSRGRSARWATLVVAAWLRFTLGYADDGTALPLADPLAGRIRAALDAAPRTPAGVVDALFALREVFPAEVAGDDEVRADVTAWLVDLERHGVAGTLAGVR